MNKPIGKWCYAAAAALLLCLGPRAIAQTETLQINDPPSNNILDNIYVGSYSATNTQTGAGVQIVCDDFQDNSDYNAATYTVNTFNSLGNTLWGKNNPNATQQYDEAAWLTLQMLGQSGNQQGYYSYAIWAVFDPTDVANWLTKHNDMGACNAVFGGGSWNSGQCNGGSGGYLKMASTQTYTAGEFSNFIILTPQGCNGAGTCPEQEFLLLVPEGGTAATYLLLAGICCFGAIFIRNRRPVPGARPVV
jgi:hypothetical protein